MKLEAGGKPWRRKPSAAPAVSAASTPAALRSSESAITARVDRGDRADAGGEPVDAVDEVDHVDDGDDPEHGHAGRRASRASKPPTNGRVRSSTRTPARTGIIAAAVWPEQLRQRRQVVDVVERRRPRRSPPRRAGSRGVSPSPGSQIQPGDLDRRRGSPAPRAAASGTSCSPRSLRAGRSPRPGGRAARRSGTSSQAIAAATRKARTASVVVGHFAACPWTWSRAGSGYSTAPRAPSTEQARGRAGGGRPARSIALAQRAARPGRRATWRRPSAISASSTPPILPAEGGEDGRAEGHRLAVHRAAGADHEVGEGDQALGVDRPLGDDQVGGAQRPRPRRPGASVRGMTTAWAPLSPARRSSTRP